MKDKWVMYYTATSKPEGGNHVVYAVTSKDLLHWSDKKLVYTDPGVGTWGGNTESPQVIRRGKYYYLFIGPGAGYTQTKVYRSTDPFNWVYDANVPVLKTHAAEIVRDLDGQWYISHCGWDQGGVYLAPLIWNDGVKDSDTSVPVPNKIDVTKQAQTKFRKISAADYYNKMKGGWFGQMVGVTWGFPTEFKYNGVTVPEANVSVWKPEMINGAFSQDDIYVEMTYLSTLQKYGFDVSQQQAGIDFANSKYDLWHANYYGRENLRKGIAPPDSGHPQFTKHSDDIDFQIEADFAGLIAPGMPNFALEVGNKFGSLMNYGDGLYGGFFMEAMYSEAFFENDINKIIENALQYIPAECLYAETIRDVIKWHKENPDDWQKTWKLVYDKSKTDPRYEFQHKECNIDIDAKLNGAWVVMGLLYGQGNLEKTIEVTMRCGQDSDCNPSSAAGVLCTILGYDKIDEKYKKIDINQTFSNTNYDVSSLFDVCETLARKAVYRNGGYTEKGSKGEEVFVISVSKPSPVKFQPSYNPGPILNSKFTAEQLQQITVKPAN
jgi:hypothetical protein